MAKNATLDQAVKTVFKGMEKSGRPLPFVFHAEDGKQFITDGHMAVVFEQEQRPLYLFEQRDAPASRGFMNEVSKCMDESDADAKETIPEHSEEVSDDVLIMNNIDRFIATYEGEDKKAPIPVWLFEAMFDARLVKKFCDVIRAAQPGKASTLGALDNIFTIPKRFGLGRSKILNIRTAAARGCVFPMMVISPDGGVAVQKEEATEHRTRVFLEVLEDIRTRWDKRDE